MLIAIIVVYILLIFPVFIRFEGNIDKDTKTLQFKIKIFKFITILFGYAELIDEGVAIHVNNIKAFIVYYKDFFSIQNKIKPLKDYHLYRFNSVINIGADNNETLLSFFTLYNVVSNTVGHSLNLIKPYVKVKNDVHIYKDKEIFNVKFNFVIVLNLLMIVLSIIKIYLEKIIYAIKGQQN